MKKNIYLSSTRGCGGQVRRKKTRVGGERKLLPVTLWDEVIKIATATTSKSRFDKHLFSGPIILFPHFLSLTWAVSLFSVLCHQIEMCQARGMGRRMKKIRSRIPQVQSGQRGTCGSLRSRWVEEERKTFIVCKWLFSMSCYIVFAYKRRQSSPWEAVPSSPDTF